MKPKLRIQSFCLLAILFISLSSHSQTVMNTTGTTVSNADYVVEYSIGEIAIATILGTGNDITQGLLQPVVKPIVSQCPVILTNTFKFENPARNKVMLGGNYYWVTDYQIYAADGKLVAASKFTNNYIDITKLPAAVYFIRLLPGCDGSYKVIKVIKQ